jgi:hypothetical protein
MFTFEEQQAARIRRENENIGLFHAAVNELTGHLADGPWNVETHDIRTWLTLRNLSSGFGICAQLDEYKKRISFSGDYPEAAREHHSIINYARSRLNWSTSPSITVSLTKKPAAIAKDIERRLLPDALRMAEMVKQIRAEHDAHENAGKTNMERIAGLLGKEPPKKNGRPEGDKEISFMLERYRNGDGYGDITCRGDKVEIRIRSINIELAERVLKVLTGQA